MLRPVRGVLCEEGIQTASRATCSIGGCEKPQKPHARGWCAMHYERWRMHGDPETVTNGENQRRGLNGVLKTVCKNGHPWTSENVVTVPSTGVHTCRICRREAEARYRCKQRTMKGQV